MHPGGENLELAYPPRVYFMSGQIPDFSYREVANQKSRGHKSWERWLAPQSVVGWGSLKHYWCCPSCTWCSNEIVVDMWTTSDGDCSATSLVSVWTSGVGGMCGWLSPSPKCNASIVDKPANGIHFFVIGGILSNCVRKCLTVICHWMPLLSKNFPNGIVRGIYLDLKWLLQVW